MIKPWGQDLQETKHWKASQPCSGQHSRPNLVYFERKGNEIVTICPLPLGYSKSFPPLLPYLLLTGLQPVFTPLRIDHKCSKESDFPDPICSEKVARLKDANRDTLDFFHNCDSNPDSLNCVMVQKIQVSRSFQALSIPSTLCYVVPSHGLCDNCGSWKTGVGNGLCMCMGVNWL